MTGDEWGATLVWPCGHQAMVLGAHTYGAHPHFCPQCDPRARTVTCGVEYLDVH